MARVHKASLFMAGLVSVFVAVYRIGDNWAAGFLLAAFWSVANLWMLERVVRLALRPGKRDAVAIALAVLVKLPLLHGLLILLVLKGGFAATSIGAGVSVPLVVIFLKAASRMLVTRMRAGAPALPEPRS